MVNFPTPKEATTSDFIDSEVERISDELNCGERKIKVKRAIVKEITDRLEAAGWTATKAFYNHPLTSNVTLDVVQRSIVK